MLGRAVKCLDRGILHRADASAKDLIQSRRMLHSAFWRHGAGDLDLLPAWGFHVFSTLFEPERTAGLDSHWPRPAPPPAARRLFDLLYPEQTECLIARFSIFSWRQWRRNLRRWNAAIPLRAFTSSGDRLSEDDPASSQSQYPSSSGSSLAGDPPSCVPPSKTLKELQDYLAAFKSGRTQESWSATQLYLSLDPAEKTTSLTHALIDLLANSRTTSDVHRAVQLFESIAVEDRQPGAYPTILAALLQLNDVARGIRLIEEALESHINPSVAGADTLLARFIADRQWQLLFRLWRRCIESFENIRFLSSWQDAFFKKTFSMHECQGRIASLLDAIDAFPNSFSPEADKFFVASAVNSVFASGRHFGPKQNQRILSVMNQLQLVEPSLFEAAILRTLEDEHSDVELDSRTRCAFQIYEECRGIDPPKQSVMLAILNAASLTRNEVATYRLYDDWLTAFGTPELKVTTFFMKCFADLGDANKVESLLQRYMENDGPQSLELHYPALHVCALRGEPEAVRKNMERMKLTAHLIPNVACWNILMNAYQRNQNLAGALGCLSEMLETGITPNDYTIVTLMAIAARRGDLDLVERLYYQTTNSLNIPCSRPMDECMVLALLNSDHNQRAEDFAITVTQRNDPSQCTRMWSLIMGHYSVGPPPANIQNVLRIRHVMRTLKVPFGPYTYSAVMRAYVVARQTSRAQRILQKLTRVRNFLPSAFHYAIIINGYAQEKLFERGLRMHAEMLQRGIRPNFSSNLALLNLHAISAYHKVESDEAPPHGIRADVLDETLEDLMNDQNHKIPTKNEPRMSSARSNIVEAYPAAYFSTVLWFYWKLRAYNTVKSLLSWYERSRETYQPYHDRMVPFYVLCAIMKVNYLESAHHEVERYWNLAKEIALKISVSGDQIRQNKEPDWLPSMFRTSLARPLDIYLRSLDVQSSQTRMQEEINQLLAQGFDLDSKNWNLYVRLLATREYFLDAFTVCESRLMPVWKGWDSGSREIVYGKAREKKTPATDQRQIPIKYSFLRRRQLEVEYATIVRLSYELTKMQRRAPFERAIRDVLAEVESRAPITIRAVRDMPMVHNATTRHLFGTRRVRYWKRGR